MIAGNKDFVPKNPVATKRAMRAILKASMICAAEPELAVRLLVDRGLARNYDRGSAIRKIIAQGTDWRFVNELQKELKP